MHELAVCQALLNEVERIAGTTHAGPVSRVVLRVGPLSGVEPQLLARAFDIARAGGVAADAELAIEPSAVRVECPACHAISLAAANRLVCGECGAWRTRLVEGDELVLQRIEFLPAPSADAHVR